ncbi:MAG: heavy-metal-associated domain-containing protein [Planctomycetaceae bacterium]
MRSAVYALAVIAAAGIAYVFATAPVPKPAATAPAASTAVSHQVMPDSGTMTLRVDDMHCPFACYPAVKKTLEGQGNVVAVELDKQQVEGAIDNPQVLIKYDSGFDLTAALDALSKKGFAKHSVVE